MASYEGMCWFKCDLQVQTPEDNNHWADDDLRLGNPRRPKTPTDNGNPDETGVQEKARRFLWRCHELKLDVIGITDHNFSEKSEPRDWFLTHLLEQNKAVANEFQRPMLYILPGFEVDIGYHVLCLFEPARKISHLWRVSSILTKLGLPENQRFRNGTPEPLRYNGETVSLKRLIDIVQNEHRGMVVAAHADDKDGLLYDARHIKDYRLPGLLALEVTSNPPQKKYLEILEGRNREWCRTNGQPAYVMSSDAKSLKVNKESGYPVPNSLGYRYTWIKMSKPSIEALRQAFLDPQSRIALPDNTATAIRPSEAQTHPRLRHIAIKNLKFLADQELEFSQNLTAVIGGRGSGKSTLLECLRLALGKDKDLESASAAKLQRVKDTFTQETEIHVAWEGVLGQPDTIVFRPRQGVHRLVNSECADFRTFLNHIPAQFFSQQQLSDLTRLEQYGNRLLPLLDAACGAELQALASQETALRTAVQQSFAARDQLTAIRGNITRLKQELAELERQWQARKDVQQDALAHQRALAARRYSQQVRTHADETCERIQLLAEDLADSHAPLGSEAAHWPHADWFQNLDAQADALMQAIREKLLENAGEYQRAMAALFEGNVDWPQVSEDLNAAESRFLTACEARGLQPQDVSRLQEIDRQRQTKQRELASQESQARQLETQQPLLQQRLNDLHGLWQQQYQRRLAAAEQINGKTSAIRVSVQYMGDPAAFTAIWSRFSPDGRSRLGRSWDDLGKQVFLEFPKQQHYLSPWELLFGAVKGECNQLPAVTELLEPLKEHITASLPLWRETRLTRVADFIDIELRRVEDGSSVGTISGKQLSEGQRNTAVLNLLLAQGDGPIVIDQPEDELDSNFIYHDLVPLLRQVKNERQLILSTHNANLPVNGDAELIYALEARDGHGCVRTQGGLDRADVSKAVLDIMEGSAEAFRRRREKYHF